jgi:hypothetical protein
MFKKLIFQHLLIFCVFTCLYIISFHCSIISSQKVLFYRGLGLLLIVTFVMTVLVIIFKKQLQLSTETLIAAIIVSVSVNLAFFITFPITYDRSITMYLLDRINNPPSNTTCQGYTESQLEQRLLTEYIQEKQALRKRIQEQKVINFIKQDNQCISITNKAKRFLQYSEIIKKIYGVSGL